MSSVEANFFPTLAEESRTTAYVALALEDRRRFAAGLAAFRRVILSLETEVPISGHGTRGDWLGLLDDAPALPVVRVVAAARERASDMEKETV